MSLKSIFPQFIKNYFHFIRAFLANLLYRFPSKEIKIIGVTGTNGKTTTTQMIAKILEESGQKVAMVSTISFKIGAKEWVNTTKFTTHSSFQIQKFISQALNAGCEYLILETSSHSLDQYRVWGIRYDTAVITNVTREHLDYHKTMEEYRRAKRGLFRSVETIVVNLDMENPKDFIVPGAKNKFGYTTLENSDNFGNEIRIIKAQNFELGLNYSKYRIQDTEFSLKMPGRFNVENALAATCVALSYEIPLKIVSEALGKITGVPGRMEEISNKMGIRIIIDYAVTPDSMEKVGRVIKESYLINPVASKLFWVFGACGDRDRGKRPLMGKIAAKYADVVILTNEDPYHENPGRILEEINAGIKQYNSCKNPKLENKNVLKIMDRRKAIKRALTQANSGDVVLITGKGAEENMKIKDKLIPWNDKRVVCELLDKMQ